MNILLFEDSLVARLSPVTTGRPAYAIACGAYRLVDLIAAHPFPVTASVRPHLTAIQAADFPQLGESFTLGEKLLLRNALLVPSVALV